MTRCDATCKYPCARDHRTKAEKIAAMRAGATTPGERAAADAAASRVKQDAPTAPRQAAPRPQRAWSSATSTTNTHGQGARAYFFWDESPTAEFIRQQQREHEQALERELLKRAQAAETLRAHGFTMPGDHDFFSPAGQKEQEILREMIRQGKIKPTEGFEEE